MIVLPLFLLLSASHASTTRETEPFDEVRQVLHDAESAGGLECLDRQQLSTIATHLQLILDTEDCTAPAEASMMEVAHSILDTASKERSHEAVAIAAMAKGVLLDSLRVRLMEADTKGEGRSRELREVREIIEELALDPKELVDLLIPDRISATDAQPVETLVAAVEAICQEWGYDTAADCLHRQIVSVPPTPALDSLLYDAEREGLLYRLLDLERVRVMLDGSVEFLSRGGDPSKLDGRDARSLTDIVPMETARQFDFPISGKRFLSVWDVIAVFEEDSDCGTVIAARQIRLATFEAYRNRETVEGDMLQRD